MGKIAKILLALIIIIAVLLPAVALRIRGRIFDHEETIAGLERTLEETRKELEETQQTLQETRDELSETRDQLARTRRDLESARADIRRLEGELSTEKEQREKAEADLRTRTRELASAREEIGRKDSEIGRLRSTIERLEGEKKALQETIEEKEGEIATLERIAGVAELDVEDVPLTEGRVVQSENAHLTASFRGNLGIMPWSNLFVYRRGRIIERVPMRQLHETNVVFEFSPEDLEKIRPGDFVVLGEDAGLLVPGGFAGEITNLHRHGFATITLAEEVILRDIPKVSVYRGDELLLEKTPGGLVSIITVAELSLDRDSRIRSSDFVRIEK